MYSLCRICARVSAVCIVCTRVSAVCTVCARISGVYTVCVRVTAQCVQFVHVPVLYVYNLCTRLCSVQFVHVCVYSLCTYQCSVYSLYVVRYGCDTICEQDLKQLHLVWFHCH